MVSELCCDMYRSLVVPVPCVRIRPVVDERATDLEGAHKVLQSATGLSHEYHVILCLRRGR